MKKKMKKKKPQTRAVIENSYLARALFLTKAKKQTSWVIDVIRFNAETQELVATDGRVLLVVKIKSTGVLLPFDLETGFYEIFGETLLKADKTDNPRFPDYKSVMPEGDVICTGSILDGIIICMIKQEAFIDIWRYESILKILNKFSSDWVFMSVNKSHPIMMEASNSKYNVKYVMMPTTI